MKLVSAVVADSRPIVSAPAAPEWCWRIRLTREGDINQIAPKEVTELSVTQDQGLVECSRSTIRMVSAPPPPATPA